MHGRGLASTSSLIGESLGPFSERFELIAMERSWSYNSMGVWLPYTYSSNGQGRN